MLAEPLSKDYLESFIKTQNYFNSLLIADKKLRDMTFNRKIYLMPSKEEIKLLEGPLAKKQ
jgi:hypothetical protein